MVLGLDSAGMAIHGSGPVRVVAAACVVAAVAAPPLGLGSPPALVVAAMSVTPALFAEALLGKLGMPISQNNVDALVAFQAREGGHMHNAAAFNPMNTTLKLPGSHPVTPVGVQAYESWDQGLEATARTLAQGNMSAITAALRRSAHPDETLRAVASSPWGCTICGNAPASTFRSYADKVFPGKGTLLPPAIKYGAMGVVGLLALGGLVLVGIGIKKKVEERKARRWAQSS